MKKRFVISFFLLGVAYFLLVSFGGKDSKYPSGSPAGYTGSPSDNKDCTQCHGGSATTVAGWITSNVPAEGYTPGTSYIITVTVTGSGGKGFEVSPQSVTGTMLGSLSAGSGNKIVGTKYVTQSSSVSGNPATWTFNWTAPVAGTGPVTFYGAFAISMSSTKLSTLTIPEKAPTSISNISDDQGIKIFPNPVKSEMTVSLLIQNSERINISISDMTGKKLCTLLDEILPPGPLQKSFDLRNLLPSGIYFVTLSNGSNINVSKKVVLCF